MTFIMYNKAMGKPKKDCSKCDKLKKACDVAKHITIIGKCTETRPHVHHPCQGQRWISHDYQTEYVYNDCEWHLIDQKPEGTNVQTLDCDKVLVNYKFKEHTTADILEKFNANVLGTDGSLSVDAEGLLISANPFTATTPVGGGDNIKHLRYWNTPFTLSDKYETYYEAEVAVKQYVTIEQVPEPLRARIRNVNEDIRLCCGILNTLDVETWTACDIILSNEKIYCLVERLPFGKTDMNQYASYSAGIPVHGRGGDPYNDFVKVGIGMMKSKAHYYINGELVFTVPRFGIRQLDEYRLVDHQGSNTEIKLNSSYFGFGLFSLLDMQLPNNYSRQLVNGDFATNQSASGLVQLDLAETYGETLPGQNGDNRPIIDENVTWAVNLNDYPDNNHDMKLFGQGAAIRIKYFKVCIRY